MWFISAVLATTSAVGTYPIQTGPMAMEYDAVARDLVYFVSSLVPLKRSNRHLSPGLQLVAARLLMIIHQILKSSSRHFVHEIQQYGSRG